MIMKLRLLIAICVLLIPASVFADEVSFRCKVKNEYQLTDDGQLVKSEKLIYVDHSFTVERSTGKVFGYPFFNQSDYHIKVVDSSDTGSFKVLFYSERGIAESLAIKTRQEGSQKPFIGIDFLQTVFTGVCD